MAAVININDARPGASPEDWQHFDLVLGLTEDLLPVVSNPKATISPESTMKDVGKTPSRYNGQRQAVGFGSWTQHKATPEEIGRWQKERDYGICIQTRRVRALDIDVSDPDAAQLIRDAVTAKLGHVPRRFRANSGKCLFAFEVLGDLTKRKFKTAHGIVEFLATGQQFIAVGTHPSGVRYEWEGGLPDAFPVLTAQEFEALWSELVKAFAIEDSTTQSSSVKAQKLADVIANDPVAQHLLNRGHVKRTERDGRLHITCPWEHEHSGDSSDSSTTYWPAHTGGYSQGHFACLHAHCEHRSDQEFKDAIEYAEADDFAAIAEEGADPAPITDEAVAKFKYRVQSVEEFCDRPMPSWILKGILPKAELAVLFGESGSGKSFLALDMAAAIAQGKPWRGMKTERTRIVFVAAEGAGGFRKRLDAYCHANGLSRRDLDIGVVDAAPNLTERADVSELAKSIKGQGGAGIVVIDTLAQSMAGGDENSSEHMGRALGHCKGLHRALGGALVILIHHAGKDTSKGARGWSGLRAAADAELEVARADDARVMTVTKQKDGEDGGEFGFRLNQVVLGLDADGEEISSCVIEHTEGGARGLKRDKGPKGDVQRIVVRQLEDLMGVGNEPVDYHDLVEVVKNQMPFDSGEGKRDHRNFRIQRALESLQASQRIAIEKLKVRLV